MRILLACEESQTVCKELRKLGHEAFSCDLLPCSGGHPEWHLQMDVFEAIKLKKGTLVFSIQSARDLQLLPINIIIRNMQKDFRLLMKIGKKQLSFL